jgi:hypothetical protein
MRISKQEGLIVVRIVDRTFIADRFDMYDKIMYYSSGGYDSVAASTGVWYVGGPAYWNT